jgi:hypothetical protein
VHVGTNLSRDNRLRMESAEETLILNFMTSWDLPNMIKFNHKDLGQ